MTSNQEDLQIQRKHAREENKIVVEDKDEFGVFTTLMSFLIMVIDTSHYNKYRLREVSCDENEHAHRKFI